MDKFSNQSQMINQPNDLSRAGPSILGGAPTPRDRTTVEVMDSATANLGQAERMIRLLIDDIGGLEKSPIKDVPETPSFGSLKCALLSFPSEVSNSADRLMKSVQELRELLRV